MQSISQEMNVKTKILATAVLACLLGSGAVSAEAPRGWVELSDKTQVMATVGRQANFRLVVMFATDKPNAGVLTWVYDCSKLRMKLIAALDAGREEELIDLAWKPIELGSRGHLVSVYACAAEQPQPAPAAGARS